MRRTWLVSALALACSRENPSFQLTGGATTGVTTDATTGVTTGVTTDATTTSTTTSGPDTTSTTTDATSTTTSGTTGEPAPVCPLWPEPGLDWQFFADGAPLKPGNNCQPESFRGLGTLSLTSIKLSPNLGCNANVNGSFEIKVGVFEFPPVEEACFQIDLTWNSQCSAVSSALLSYYEPMLPDFKIPIAVGVVGSESVHPDTPPELRPTLELVEPCSCGPDIKDCCVVDELPDPGGYRLNFNGVTIEPGEETPPDAPIIVDVFNFSVTNLRTHMHADCSESPLHVDWYARLQE